MNIEQANFSKTQKIETSTKPKQTWFNRSVEPDKFIKSNNKSLEKNKKMSISEEMEALANLKVKGSQTELRFTPSDIERYMTEQVDNGLTYDMVMKLVDTTDFDMKTMGKVAKKMRSTYDLNCKLIDDINNCAKNLPKGIKPNDFKANIFEPKKELQLIDTNQETGYSFDISNKDAKLIYETKTDLLKKLDNAEEQPYIYYKKSTTTDHRNNFVSETITEVNKKKRFPEKIYSETIKRYSKDGKLLRTEIMKESDVKGIYNITYQYPDGKVEDVVKASIDKKTEIKTVKKDMKSSDGTRTEFLYEDDPIGNRLIDYKITSPDGKILMKNSQTFEVINDNHFISSKNGHKYDIKTTDKSLTIKDVHHSGKEASINFNKLIKGNKQEIINLLKKVPGEELFEIIDCCEKIKGNDHNDILDSSFSPFFKEISMADNLFVFLHELGHAKDAEPYTYKNLLKNKKISMYEQDPTIQQEYLKERKIFNQNFSDDQRENISYFIKKEGHYGGEWGGLQELVAETNALANSVTNEDVELLSARSQYAQQHFPRTIAAIQNAMNYKNDIEAINYYGT